MPKHHLAQINIARMVAPMDDPIMSGFVAQLDHINTVAEQSPGFVWRLKEDDGNATSLRVFDEPHLLINMSVWQSIDALRTYVYNSDHTGPLKDRKTMVHTNGRSTPRPLVDTCGSHSYHRRSQNKTPPLKRKRPHI